MKILFFALFIIIVLALFFLLNKIICALAYRKDMRYLHCRTIPAVLIALLVATNVYTVSYPVQLIDKIINAPVLANFFNMIMPNRAYELLYMLLMIIGLNLLVILFVTIILGVIKLIFSKRNQYVDIDDYTGFEKLIHLPWWVTSKFYSNRNGEVSLRSKGFTFGLWMKGFKCAFAVLFCVEILTVAVSILWGKESWNTDLLPAVKNWYLLPMASFLLLEQIQFFFEGKFEPESGTFSSADTEQSQDGKNMEKLMNAYMQTFGKSKALLLSDMNNRSARINNGLESNRFSNRQISDCKHTDVLNVIANQLKQCGATRSESYQNALIELINGQSVNICDYCEGEFLISLTAYLNFNMAQGKTALFLCRNAERAERICENVKTEMQRINSLYSVWNICTLEGAENNANINILVCSFDEFLSRSISKKRKDFMNDLFCVIVADGIELFSQDSVRIERLFGELRSDRESLQYIVFSGINNDSLRTAIEQTIKKEILPFHNDEMKNNTGIMVWGEESFYKLQQHIGIGSALSPYMGVALPVALVAAKYDMPQMHIIEEYSRGDRSFNDVLSMSSKEVDIYIDKNLNLKSIIRNKYEEVLAEKDISMIIAYDTDYNFYNALWRWMKYSGKNGSLLHIISPSYMMREYFVANYKEQALLMKNNEFDALISYHLSMKISHMAVLLVVLCNEGMTEEELLEKSKEYSWDYENIESMLKDCLRIVFTDKEIHSVYEHFHFEEQQSFCPETNQFKKFTRITMANPEIKERLQESINCVELVSKNNQHTTLPILMDNVYNYYLREQVIAVNGYLYQIQSISNGKIYAEQTLPQDLLEYFQISDFIFTDYKKIDQCIDYGFMDLNVCTANVTRRIYGYWSNNRGNCIAANCNAQLNDLRDIDNKSLDTQFNCSNILEINIKKSVLGDDPTKAVRLFAFTLKELFKTLFPLTHQNLFTVMPDGFDEELIERVLSEGKDSDINDIICSIIPGVHCSNETKEGFITLYVVELSCIEYGMVQMLYSKFKSIILILRQYLNWYIKTDGESVSADITDEETSTEDENQDGQGTDSGREELNDSENSGKNEPCITTTSGSYLGFGLDHVPDVFDICGLLKLCHKIVPEVEETHNVNTDVAIETDQFCVFCGRPSFFPVVLSDGRSMCGHCHEHQLTQKDEIKSMFMETRAFMIDGYNINIAQNIHVRFQSATAIANATGNTSGGRVLGFYNPSNHQLWLESRGPSVAMQGTLIHELTHVWQAHDKEFSTKFQKMLKKFVPGERDAIRLLLLEGHATYIEIETMRRMHEEAYADRIHAITMQRQDEYGIGYRLIYDYIKNAEQSGSHMTPFAAMTQLAQDIIDGKVTVK